jgi:hypothetical protein
MILISTAKKSGAHPIGPKPVGRLLPGVRPGRVAYQSGTLTHSVGTFLEKGHHGGAADAGNHKQANRP